MTVSKCSFAVEMFSFVAASAATITHQDATKHAHLGEVRGHSRIAASDVMTITYVLEVKDSTKAVKVELPTVMPWNCDCILLQPSLNCLMMLDTFSKRWMSECVCEKERSGAAGVSPATPHQHIHRSPKQLTGRQHTGQQAKKSVRTNS